MSSTVSIPEFITQQRAALKEERDAEKREIFDAISQLSPKECQDKGLSLLNLVLNGHSTALYGRTCLTLGPSSSTRSTAGEGKKAAVTLPAHKFGVGDEVSIFTGKGPSGGYEVQGVVCRVSPIRIDVICHSDVNDETIDSLEGSPLRMNLLANEATHTKMMNALANLEKYWEGPALRLVNVLFGLKAPLPASRVDGKSLKTVSADLNDPQKEAVAFALSTDDVALIHGPPGTGKTTAVVELLFQAVAAGLRVLVCAPSNVAVDNIVDRIVNARSSAGNPKIVRLGHPARLAPHLLRFSLEALIEGADGTEIVRDVRAELRSLEDKMPRDKSQRRSWRSELKALKREVRTREERVVKHIISSRDIVLCTNVGAASRVLREMSFDLCVIDEAAQALEASCWIPILKASQLVLAGDHKQLPPTIKSSEASSLGLGLTLFDRLMKLVGETNSRILTVQYRMHDLICRWASDEMYGGALVAAPEVAHQKISDLPGANGAEDMTDATLLLLDTAGCGMEEERAGGDAEGGGSRRNEGEAKVVEAHLRALIAAGLPVEDIAVITPYNGQVELLQSILIDDFPRLEIRSVDGFQGGEREAVVLSLVRSNPEKIVGFLSDDRRLNVAITRAKRHCAVICDTECVSSHPFLKRLVGYFQNHGEHRSAMEYVEDYAGAVSNVPSVTSDQKKGQKKTSTTTKAKAGGAKTNGAPGPAKKGDPGKKGEERGKFQKGGAPREFTDAGLPKEDGLDDNAVVAMVLRFVTNPSQTKIELPAEIRGRQRKMIHELLEKLAPGQISHTSVGVSFSRRMILEKISKSEEDRVVAKKEESIKAVKLTAEAMFGPVVSSDSDEEEGEEEAEESTQAAGEVEETKGAGGASGGGSSWLAGLHQERMAREAARKPKPKGTAKKNPFGLGSAGGGEAEDDLALIERAIEGNMNMTELINPHSDAKLANAYGWNRDIRKKRQLQKKLSEKISDVTAKRTGENIKEKKKGGEGGSSRGGASRGGRSGRGGPPGRGRGRGTTPA